MAKANEFLKKIGEKFGLSAEEITKLTGVATLSDIEIDDAIATKISNTELLTEESAASNSKVRGKIRSEVLDGIDADNKRIALKHGLSEDEYLEISKLDKTSLRLEKAAEKIAEKQKLLATSSGKDKTVLEKEIEKLNADTVALKNSYDAKIAALNTDRANDQLNWELEGNYNSLEWHVPEGMDKEIITTGGRALIEKKLREKGIVLKKTETGLMPFNADDTAYFETNNKITGQDLLKKFATENKLLKVSGGEPNQQKQHQFNNQNNGDKKIVIADAGLQAAIAESMKRDLGI